MKLRLSKFNPGNSEVPNHKLIISGYTDKDLLACGQYKCCCVLINDRGFVLNTIQYAVKVSKAQQHTKKTGTVTMRQPQLLVNFEEEDVYRTHFDYRYVIKRKLYKNVKSGDWNDILKLIEEHGTIKIFYLGLGKTITGQITPLSLSCKNGHAGIVREFTQLKGSKFKIKAWDYQVSVLQAAAGGHQQCLREVVASIFFKSDLIYGDSSKKNICYNAKLGDFEKAVYLLKDEHVQDRNLKESGVNLMNLLVICGCPISCLEALVSLGVDMNICDTFGLTPLICAVAGENTDCVRFLLEKGVGLHTRLEDDVSKDLTPLSYAAALKNCKMLEILLEYCNEEDLNRRVSKIRLSALTFACLFGNTKSFSLLVQSGAKIEIYNKFRTSLIYPAMESGNPDFLTYFLGQVSEDYCQKGHTYPSIDTASLVQHVACLRLLVAHFNMDLNAKTNTGKTLLTEAASCGFLDSVEWLIENGADINMTDGDGNTPLLCSCLKNQDEVTAFLIKLGADVNSRNTSRKESPIMTAVCFRNIPIIQSLLACPDLDVSVQCLSGLTVLHLAILHQVGETILTLLFESGKFCERRPGYSKWSEGQELSDGTVNTLLKYGAFDWQILHNGYRYARNAYRVVTSGFGPGQIIHIATKWKVNPLVLAFMRQNRTVAKYFLTNLYFFPEDYNTLCTHTRIRKMVYGYDTHSLAFLLEQLTHHPLSLQNWCFLTVSKQISLSGPAALRAQRVNALPMPNTVKKALVFQTNLSQMCPKYFHRLTSLPLNIDINKRVTWYDERTRLCGERCEFCQGCGLGIPR